MDARSSYSTTHLHENETKVNEIELKVESSFLRP